MHTEAPQSLDSNFTTQQDKAEVNQYLEKCILSYLSSEWSGWSEWSEWSEWSKWSKWVSTGSTVLEFITIDLN